MNPRSFYGFQFPSEISTPPNSTRFWVTSVSSAPSPVLANFRDSGVNNGIVKNISLSPSTTFCTGSRGLAIICSIQLIAASSATMGRKLDTAMLGEPVAEQDPKVKSEKKSKRRTKKRSSESSDISSDEYDSSSEEETRWREGKNWQSCRKQRPLPWHF